MKNVAKLQLGKSQSLTSALQDIFDDFDLDDSYVGPDIEILYD